MDIEKWKEKNEYPRGYTHFDKRMKLSNCWNYVNNPKKIKSHSFYPFIYYEQEFIKYKRGKKIKKTRPLCYSAHIDRYIYSYYGYKINQKYNKKLISDGINESVIAYRNNFGKNNIHFAMEAIEFIKKSKESFVIIGDFQDFFDGLNHEYLKERLIDLLGGKSLKDDYYAVYKNITKYSTIMAKEILEYQGLKTIKDLNKKDVICTAKEFRKMKKKLKEGKGKNKAGIPQGSAISAVLSNVYMLEVDKYMNTLVKELNGMYRRYSDDFIIILPEIKDENFKKYFNIIFNYLNGIPGLSLQCEKTNTFKCDNDNIINYNNKCMNTEQKGKNVIEYLGFSFDGKSVRIRSKTINKYYYRMYKKIKTIVKNRKRGKVVGRKNLYKKYSNKGAKVVIDKKTSEFISRGNFITYVKRAKKIWMNESQIDKDTKKHMLKIKRRLEYN